MEKELIELYEAAQKAADVVVDGGPEEDRCIDALNRLKKFPVNYQVLVSSQVGKRLRGLTKHSSNKIKALASEVVEIWKDIIVKETMKNKKNGEIKSEGSVKVEKMKSVKVEQPMATVTFEGNNPTSRSNSEKVNSSESDKKVMKVDVVKTKRGPAEQIKVEKKIKEEESSSWTSEQIKVEKKIKVEKSSSLTSEQIKVEKIIKEEKSSSKASKPKQEPVGPPKLNSIVYCKDAVRDKMREILAEGLSKVASEVDEDQREEANACDPYRVAVLVETAMFEKWGKSNGAQKVRYRSIMFNIKDPKNPDFRRKVLLGEFPPDSITELTPEQMASEARKKQIEGIKEKALFECERGQTPKATTNEFKCGRCGKKETTYYQMQTRSADEPMTTYVTCVVCGNRWKFC